MKNNINYKILTLVPFFGILVNSCSKGKANIFMGTTPSQDTVLLKDIKTGEERILVSNSLKDVLPYFHTGDTVYLHGMRMNDKWYTDNCLLYHYDCWLEYDTSKIKSRTKQQYRQLVIEKVKKSIKQR